MLADLAMALARDGAEVHVVTSRLRYDNQTAVLPGFERLDGVAVHRVRATGFGRGELPGRALRIILASSTFARNRQAVRRCSGAAIS